MQDKQKQELTKILNREMEKLRAQTVEFSEKDVAIHEMEMGYFRTVLELCYQLLVFYDSTKNRRKEG